MVDTTTRSPDGRRWFPRALRWWAAGVTFVIGLLAGALLVGLLSGGGTTSPGAPVAAAPTRESGGAQSSESGAPAGATGSVSVDAACLRAVNAAQDVAYVMRGLGEALSTFNAARLDEIVGELQPLQDRLQGSLADCDVATGITGGAAGGSSTPRTAATPKTGTAPGD